MRTLHSLFRRFCNAGATILSLSVAAAAHAQTAPVPEVLVNLTRQAGSAGSTDEHRAIDVEKFLTGAGLALAFHESGHLLFDGLFGADVYVRSVHLGPLPFFAVGHVAGLPPREEFTISSAGFWTQEGTLEWLLTTRPDIRHEHAPLLKGIVAFDVLTSIGYGIVGAFGAGPVERDTRGMTATGISEPAVGMLVIAPAVLDGIRYFRPDATWPRWTSRAVKVASVLLVLKGR